MRHPNSNLNHNINNIHSLDEREKYFSSILSPYQNNQKQKPIDHHKVENAIKHGDCKKCDGDVNCEAEVFIRQRHRKLELNKTMPVIIE
ncbi:hypothetical protein BVRB_6g146560 [Beta vulgaris subsp. vulgaris]|nr:hypothetical protein BVRB_6g146560 [Beta vulgaris subsp. vulgaris]